MGKPKKQSKPIEPPPRCFRCDGSGKLCTVCGESQLTCRCGDHLREQEWFDCEDCGGTGR